MLMENAVLVDTQSSMSLENEVTDTALPPNWSSRFWRAAISKVSRNSRSVEDGECLASSERGFERFSPSGNSDESIQNYHLKYIFDMTVALASDHVIVHERAAPSNWP